MPPTRSTRQRDAVLRAAQSSGDHPSAEMIYEAVRREIPNVSLGTVYRNLQRLVVDGALAAAPPRGRRARFDPTTHPHDHFVCESCERIIDRPSGHVTLDGLEREGFEIRSHTVTIYGLCPDCAAARPTAAGNRDAR